jgi:glycosylphosphatidylinositol transamidase (GPIT) subunit GPI8
MKNLEVDLYITQFRGFFDKNPNDLLSLIGDVLVEDFFKRVEEQCYKNLEKGDEVSVTRQQLIDIVVDLKSEDTEKDIQSSITKVFEHTKFGDICLN